MLSLLCNLHAQVTGMSVSDPLSRQNQSRLCWQRSNQVTHTRLGSVLEPKRPQKHPATPVPFHFFGERPGRRGLRAQAVLIRPVPPFFRTVPLASTTPPARSTWIDAVSAREDVRGAEGADSCLWPEVWGRQEVNSASDSTRPFFSVYALSALETPGIEKRSSRSIGTTPSIQRVRCVSICRAS